MNRKVIIGLIALVLLVIFLIGCTETVSIQNKNKVNASEQKKLDRAKKRIDNLKETNKDLGKLTTPTNITDFNELLRRASGIESFEYNF